MKIYDLQIRVKEKNLTTVIDVLKNAADIVSMKQIDNESHPASVPYGPRRSRGNGKPKGPEVLLQIMKPNIIYKADDLGREMHSREGFSPSSVGPALSVLEKQGLVEHVGPASYKLRAQQ